MEPTALSTPQARRIAVSAQRLAGPMPPPDRKGILEIFRALRCIQLDPLRAVERTHLLVLWSRLGPFDRGALRRLRNEERVLFEYWAHAASLVLVEDYAIHRARMEEFVSRLPNSKRSGPWLEANQALRRHVLERLAEEGPLPSRQIADLSERAWASTGWTNGRTVSQMLDLLWTMGEVTVAGRDGNQRLWHLAGTWLPEGVAEPALPRAQVDRLAVDHAARALGISTARDIQNHFIRKDYDDPATALQTLVEEGTLHPVRLPDVNGGQERWYLHDDYLPLLDQPATAWAGRTTLLSPFDNLICDRSRTEKLFDFSFRIEIYVPKAKRQFGYYVLPILHGERLIGRIDSKMDRKKGIYRIESIYAEEDAPRTQAVGRAVGSAIDSLATFLGAKRVSLGENGPPAWRPAVEAVLAERLRAATA